MLAIAILGFVTMNNKVTITSSTELNHLYDDIINAIDDGKKIHLLTVGHNCSTEKIFETFINNRHPTIRCIFTSQDMIQEFMVMDRVIRRNFKTAGLDQFCPNCGGETSN